MAIRGSTNRETKLTPHKMVTGRRMPRGDRETIEIEDVDKLKSELDKYVTTLTKIHASIFQTESRPRETPDESNRSGPIAVGDLVNIKVYRRKWDEPRREGPYEVTSATHTSIKVQGSNFWYHISHCLKINTNKSEVITHEAKNLFESPEEEVLCHCISKDCALGAGIALEFRNRYGVEELVEQQKGVGECAYVEKKGRRILHLITKEKAGDRLTYDNLEQSLISARRICLEQKITTLAIPKIGCGLDRLEWSKVETLVNKIFGESTICVKVYSSK